MTAQNANRPNHTHELLRQVPTFARLSDGQLGLLAAQLGMERFARGALIFSQGSVGDRLYIVLRGKVRVYTTSALGQELSLMLFQGGDFFGELALLDGGPRSASAVAMTPTTALTLQRSAFLQTLDTCPPIAAVILEALSLRLRHSTSYAEQLASHTAPQRVVDLILDLCGSAGGEPPVLHVTQEELASLAGTSRETVNRVLATLRDRGLLRIERARLRITDLAQLRRVVL